MGLPKLPAGAPNSGCEMRDNNWMSSIDFCVYNLAACTNVVILNIDKPIRRAFFFIAPIFFNMDKLLII